MDDPSGYFLFMLLPPLLTAFVIQFFVSPLSRPKVILRSAVGWTVLVTLLTAIAVFLLPEGVDNIFQTIVSGAIVLGVGLAFSLIGALVGSELSSLLKWLFRKTAQKKQN